MFIIVKDRPPLALNLTQTISLSYNNLYKTDILRSYMETKLLQKTFVTY